MRSLGADALTFLSAALLIALSGCLDTSVDFHVEPGPVDDAVDAASPQDTGDMVGGETLVDLLDAATDLTDALIPTDTGDVPVDDTEDIEDTSDGGAPDFLDTAEDADAPDPVDALDTHDVDDADAGCTPNCDGKVCGDDGCDGSCGDCDEDLVCAAGLCLPPEYSLSCEGRCGETGVNCDCDEGCLDAETCCQDLCVVCPELLACTCGDGLCDLSETCETCVADCGCEDDVLCLGGTCCTPDCADKVCGTDSCGGTCGTCPGIQDTCIDGTCVCLGACAGLDCGPDGCGGDCGTCDDGLSCTDDACEDGLCAHTTQPFFCLIEGICVPSGTENPLNPCEKCKPTEDQGIWSPREDGFACGATAVCWLGWCCDPAVLCAEKECGPDGCGWICGVCGPNEICDDGGLCACTGDSVPCGDGCCEPGQVCHAGACCYPACGGKNCGDDGCGGSCGACTGPQDACVIGLCVCQPACAGLDCGDDGCGGDCGACTGQDACVGGACVCQPDCGGKNCGDDGCGGDCGACGPNESCTTDGFCECAEGGAVCGGGCCNPGEICHDDACCAPDCAGSECGPDGCGGLCGACTGPQDACVGGICECQPFCTGKECGTDGCGGDCGECTGQDACLGGACICQPLCAGMECGPDGCGGACGECDDGLGCTQDACSDGACVATILPDSCLLLGETCVPEGSLNPDNPCEQCVPSADQDDWTVLEDGIACGPGMVCYLGACCDAATNCTGKECGPDGCGGACGTCTGLQDLCEGGLCVCQAACSGKDCGPDGCGGDCGDCGPYEVCTDAFSCACEPGSAACGDGCCEPDVQICAAGICCTPDCAGKDCGADGCGSVCGECDAGQVCIADLCPPQGDQCDDLNETPWDGCTDGQLTEFQVDDGGGGDQLDPAVAVAGDGRFLVAWVRNDSDGQGIAARVFDADGAPLGGELALNTVESDQQDTPATAALADGRFVVVWESKNQDGDGEGVVARMVEVDGGLASPEFMVNAYTGGDQRSPAVAPRGAGFAVAWEGEGVSPNLNSEIWVRCFNENGDPAGAPYRVNAETAKPQTVVTMTPTADGGLMAAWVSEKQEAVSNSLGVFRRDLGPSCAPTGDDVQVNTTDQGDQDAPHPALISGGLNVVVWDGCVGVNADASGIGVRRISAAGLGLGTEDLANQTTTGTQALPCVAPMDGGFVVAWQSDSQDGDSTGIYFQRISSGGVFLGGETGGNVYTDMEQQEVACAGTPDGGFILVWESHDQGAGDWGIFARRYDADGQPLYR